MTTTYPDSEPETGLGSICGARRSPIGVGSGAIPLTDALHGAENPLEGGLGHSEIPQTPALDSRPGEDPVDAICIIWAGRRFEFETAAQALESGFHIKDRNFPEVP